LFSSRRLEEFDYCLRRGHYWEAEKAFEVYLLSFGQDFGREYRRPIPYSSLQGAARVVQDFARRSPLDDEQRLWAKVAILQTFCEGVLDMCDLTLEVQEGIPWAFSSLQSTLRKLVDEALSRDESGEWRRSRSFIRQQLIELDRDVKDNPAHTDDTVSLKRYESLIALWKLADANEDYIMVSSIHGRIRLLGQTPGSLAKIETLSVPYQVYAQSLDKIRTSTRSRNPLLPRRLSGLSAKFPYDRKQDTLEKDANAQASEARDEQFQSAFS
jgi:hypothetical protein